MGRDAAWLALHAIELDENCGLALCVLARLVLEVNADPLGTLATRHAMSLGLPDFERAQVERFHRIDLWTRGLIAHSDRTAILPVAAFEDPSSFREMPRFDAWLREQAEPWGGIAGAAKALVRMAAALSDARSVPEGAENPLRVDDGWEETRFYSQWKEQALGVLGEPSPQQPSPSDLTVLSDHWMEQEIAGLGALAQFGLAIERAEIWTAARPQKIAPKAALVRLHHASGDHDARDTAIETMLSIETRDLNELEEARLALGELELWGPQIRVLDRMDDLAPSHPVILANRGAALLAIEEMGLAETDLEKAIEADPDNGPALATLGLIRMRQDQYVGARELLERAVAVAPTKAQVHVYLAACKNNQGDRSGAIHELEQALELEPGHAQAKLLLEELATD